MAVIGLNLCPFAQSVYRDNRVRMRVSDERSAGGLLQAFREEALYLQNTDPRECETALMIHPWVLLEFREYNDFLTVCEAAIADLGLEGRVQVASFHPHYQFAGTQTHDIENYTNRSPYPMLHLLREDSVARAVACGDTEAIYLKNIQTLRRLGHAGWESLWSG